MEDPNKQLRNLTEAVNNLQQQGSIKPLTEQEKKDLLSEAMMVLNEKRAIQPLLNSPLNPHGWSQKEIQNQEHLYRKNNEETSRPITEQEKKDLLIESMLLLEGNKNYEAEYQDIVEAIRRCYEGSGNCKGLEGWLKRLKELEELCPDCDFPSIPKDERKTGDEIIQQGLQHANRPTQRPSMSEPFRPPPDSNTYN
jgi:hypothetical protein